MGQCRFNVWPQKCRRVTQRGLASAPWTVGEFDQQKGSTIHILVATTHRESDSLANIHEPWTTLHTFHSLSGLQDSSTSSFWPQIPPIHNSIFITHEHGFRQCHPSRWPHRRRRRPTSQNRNCARLGRMQTSQDHRRQGQPPRPTRWR